MNIQRELGENGIPVSIGTAFALEAINSSGVPAAPIAAIQEFWFNLRTLIRNILGAYPTDVRKAMTVEKLHNDLISEINIIDAYVQKHSNGRCKAVFYACSYTSLKRKFPNGQLKSTNTDAQKYAQGIENNTIKVTIPLLGNVNFRPFDVDIDGKHPSAFILTHFAVDLLSSKYFDRLALVESHTGAIKGPNLWYTKLTNGSALPMIPFNRFTLQVFGDRGICFTPLPSKLKDAVMQLASAYNWTAATTKDKIIFGIKSLNDPVATAFFNGLW